MRDYTLWFSEKSKIDSKTKVNLFFKEREIWNVSVGINVGSEIDGKIENPGDTGRRPVLILKTFRQLESPENSKFVGIPLTTKQEESIAKNERYYYRLEEREGGRGISCLDLQQIRLFSAKRLERKIKKILPSEFNSIKESIKNLLF